MQPSVVNDNRLNVPILSVNNLTVIRSDNIVLKDINLKVCKGEFIGLVGPNGSGKSTLLLSILGVLRAQKGSVEIYGQHPFQDQLLEGLVGFLKQHQTYLVM
jgi:ABC-type Mn2+/Zn2+ transport system ATPase subunit